MTISDLLNLNIIIFQFSIFWEVYERLEGLVTGELFLQIISFSE